MQAVGLLILPVEESADIYLYVAICRRFHKKCLYRKKLDIWPFYFLTVHYDWIVSTRSSTSSQFILT
jgi:hypothetical protein